MPPRPARPEIYLTISRRRFGSSGSPVVRFGLTTGGMPIIELFVTRRFTRIHLEGGDFDGWPDESLAPFTSAIRDMYLHLSTTACRWLDTLGSVLFLRFAFRAFFCRIPTDDVLIRRVSPASKCDRGKELEAASSLRLALRCHLGLSWGCLRID
ncbi:hypothetical protein FNV43_RR19883 [Rhamnella rubrinervis]|uniref:Uncharacterized protein n=1 Tax=Rhamnella rubrinervis TaxID=2594499 RepID=A0A8K0E0F7_9ROSA|nr:hypothetical protein FNV43_RR19883 [Rhamnella rubrinervis]